MMPSPKRNRNAAAPKNRRAGIFRYQEARELQAVVGIAQAKELLGHVLVQQKPPEIVHVFIVEFEADLMNADKRVRFVYSAAQNVNTVAVLRKRDDPPPGAAGNH